MCARAGVAQSPCLDLQSIDAFALTALDLRTTYVRADKDARKDKTKASSRANPDVDQCFMDLPRGSTALQWATVNQYTAIVAYLLSKGANVNQKTRKGQVITLATH